MVGTIGEFGAALISVVSGLAFHPQTNVLYASLAGSRNPGGIVTIDTRTGRGTLVARGQRLTGLAFDPETSVLYGIDNGLGQTPDALYTVDVNTGAATLVGYTGLENPLGLEFVPEPGSALMAVAGAMLLLERRTPGRSRSPHYDPVCRR